MSMNTTVSRLNTSVSTAFTVLTYCAAVMAATSFVLEMSSPGPATGKMVAHPSRVVDLVLAHPLLPAKKRPIQRAVVKFDIDADFSRVFNWNTKQLYVFVVAEYETKDFKRNTPLIFPSCTLNLKISKVLSGTRLRVCRTSPYSNT